MGAFFFALIALCILAILKIPDAAYDIKAEQCRRKTEEAKAAWKELVTIDPDEEHDLCRRIAYGSVHIVSYDSSEYDAYRAEFDTIMDDLKEQYPGYTGCCGHEYKTGAPVSSTIGVQRMVLAKRGKLKLADALFGIMGTEEDLPFVLWIDSQLKEHGINEKLYFQEFFRDVHLIDDIPRRTLGEFKWDPQIGAQYKRPDE